MEFFIVTWLAENVRLLRRRRRLNGSVGGVTARLPLENVVETQLAFISMFVVWIATTAAS